MVIGPSDTTVNGVYNSSMSRICPLQSHVTLAEPQSHVTDSCYLVNHKTFMRYKKIPEHVKNRKFENPSLRTLPLKSEFFWQLEFLENLKDYSMENAAGKKVISYQQVFSIIYKAT